MTPESLWEYVLALYSQPDVEALCLRLQDDHAINVNVLLFARWLETRDITLRLSATLACVSDWDREYVQVLRQLRRRMKQEFALRLAEVAQVRDHIKCAELLAERQQLTWLAQLAETWRGHDGIVPGENIRLYLNHRRVPESVITEAVAAFTRNAV